MLLLINIDEETVINVAILEKDQESLAASLQLVWNGYHILASVKSHCC
jgi:hypothetical protein